jgi:hypothetical protein
MKLTAKLLKKIIREAVQAGVPGIGKFYDDDDMKLPVDYAKQGAELSSMFGKDIEAKDVSESILIEVKEIIADFVDQYFKKFISDVGEAEGAYNWPDEIDAEAAIKGRIESLIDNTYYMSPSTLRSKIFAVIIMKMFKNRNLRPYAKVVRNKMRQLDRFYSSYDDLYNALANKAGKAPELEKLDIKEEVNEAIKEYADLVRGAKKLKAQPVENYKNYIRLANSKEQVAKIFQRFISDLKELRTFMIRMTMRNTRYYNVEPPGRYIIDPEKSEFEDNVGYKYKDYRKTIESKDPKTGLKDPMQIVDEVERYVEERIAGDVIAQAGHPKVQQKFMPEKFPMDEAKLKRMIFEELKEMYAGEKKVIIAPQMDRPPGERYSWEEPGSYFDIPESPYQDLHPAVQAKFPEDAPDQALTQAHELSSALGHEPQDKKVEDFLQGIKDYGNIDLPRQEAIEALKKYISELKKDAMALPSGERSAAIQTIRALNARLSTLKRSKTTKDVHNQTPFGKKIR